MNDVGNFWGAKKGRKVKTALLDYKTRDRDTSTSDLRVVVIPVFDLTSLTLDSFGGLENV